MRITRVLNGLRREFVGPIPKHKGNVLTGKDRFVPPITLRKKIQMFQKLKMEEANMKYLSKAYISESQEEALLNSMGKTHPEYWDDFMSRPIEIPLKQYYAADYLEKLNISRSFAEED